MSNSVEVAIQQAAASAATAGPTTPIIIKEDRSIVVPTALQQIAVLCDNEANVLHFECPRNWADIDLATAALYINVVKPDKSTVAFTCTNVVSSEDTVTFDWVITEPVTDVAGKLSFLVCARDPSDPGDGYRWHSNLCDSLFIAPGIACTVPSDTPDPPHIPLYGTDTTLTRSGVPADAAAVGDRLNSLSEEIANIPQDDWNSLANKPFYDESKTLLAWDGDVTGHETIDFVEGMSLVYLGDSIIDPSVLIGATATTTNGVDEYSGVIIEDNIGKGYENVYIVAVEESGFYLVTADNTTISDEDISLTFPYAGIYAFPKELSGGIYLSSIVETVIKRIDNKFLPTVCRKTADAEGNISLEASDVGAAKLFVVTETSYGVVDKNGHEIEEAVLAGCVVVLKPLRYGIMYYSDVPGDGGWPRFFSVSRSSDLHIPVIVTARIRGTTVEYSESALPELDNNGSIQTVRDVFMRSSTEGSVKQFRITVDDSGTISAKEI